MGDTLTRIAEYCLAKAGAYEDHPWGETVFKVAPKGKVFCFCGTESPLVTVKSSLEKQAALIQHPNIETAKYVGRYGWITISMRDEETFELALELIDESYGSVVAGTGTRRKSRA